MDVGKCPSCGTALDASAPSGLCPKCLRDGRPRPRNTEDVATVDAVKDGRPAVVGAVAAAPWRDLPPFSGVARRSPMDAHPGQGPEPDDGRVHSPEEAAFWSDRAPA